MHVAHGRARQRLQRIGELDHGVAIRTADELIEGAHDAGILGLIHARVLQVVCVHDAHDQLEAPAPIAPAVVPVEVLGLLKHA